MRKYITPLRVWQRFSHHQIESQLRTWRKPSGFDTGIVVYNPIIKEKVPLILKNDKIATWYICGPTVYDSTHIGHACCYVRFDIIRRILTEFFNINVVSVMGITDIDNKIIMRSQGSSRFSDWMQLAKFYEQEFCEQMKILNVLPPYIYGRVSDYIPQIIQFINEIIAKNLGYISKDGSVYFDRLAYGKFGNIGNYDLEKSHPTKRSNSDFALWKAAKPGEPFWESPWGPGRPGWHIECSTIGSYTLGTNIDIHSGGLDLIFPHHENEEVQSCCHHGTDQWVNYWLYSGLLHIKDTKMSKSMQNTISVVEFLDKYTVNQFRMMCLLCNYRSAVEFSHETIHKAVALVKKFEYFENDCKNYMAGKLISENIDESLVYSKLHETQTNIRKALADDFSTPTVIFELVELVAVVTKMLNPSQIKCDSGSRNVHCIGAASTYVSDVLLRLGIAKPTAVECKEDIKLGSILDTFVDFRTIVRNKALNQKIKDAEMLAACDESRKKLAACGIKIKDYKEKSSWTVIEE